MKLRVGFGKDMYRMFCVLCFVMFSGNMLLRLYGVSAPLLVAATSLFFTIFAAVVFFNRKNLLIYVCIAAIIVAARIFISIKKIEFLDFAGGAVSDFFSRTELDFSRKLFVCALFSALLSAVFFGLTRLGAVRFFAVPAVIAVFVFLGFNNTAVNAAEIFSGAGLIISVLSEVSVFAAYKKEGRENANLIMSYIVPAVAFFSLCAAFMPMTEKPIRWEAVRKFAHVVKTAVIDIASEISFSFSSGTYEFELRMQGYSEENSALGGDITEGNETLMNVKFNGMPRSLLYLIGNANAEYDGKSWSKGDSLDLDVDEYYLDYYETIRALDRSGYSREMLARNSNRISFTAEFDDITTKTLFYPLKAYSIIPDNSKNFIRTDNSSITFKKPKSSGTAYSVSYMEIDYNSPVFRDIARRGKNYASDTGHYRIFNVRIPDNIDEVYEQRAEFIRENYTALPDNITERTYALAREITKDCDNDYDKLVEIEVYLSRYSYTLTPGNIPEDSEPVDYFLFESKEGYCTYFATAMAVLARCVNIPTRYINGFAIDYSHKIDYQHYNVSTSDAHAWPEAYIEGVGWIPFEPASDYSDGRYDYNEPEYSSFDSYPTYTAPPMTPGVVGDNSFTDGEIEEESDSVSYVVVVLITISGVLLVVFLYFFVRVKLFRSRYRKFSVNDKFFICYKMIVYLCEKKCFSRGIGETADSYAEKVDSVFEHEEMSFCDITRVFDRIRYGGGTAEAEELEELERYLGFVIEEIRGMCGKIEAAVVFLGYCI